MTIARKSILTFILQNATGVGHPGIFGILHFTYFILGHAKSFSGILNSIVVHVMQRRVCRFLKWA